MKKTYQNLQSLNFSHNTQNQNIKNFPLSERPQSYLSLKCTDSYMATDLQNGIIFQQLTVSSNLLGRTMEELQWRKKCSENISKVQWICILPVQGSSNMVIQVKRKKYPFTLKDLKRVSLTQILVVLEGVLSGVQILFQKYGYFQLTQESIFFDKNLEIQVWWDKDIMKMFKPASQRPQLNNNQTLFIHNLMKLIDSHQIKSSLSYEFYNGIKLMSIRNELTFQNIKEYIRKFIVFKQLTDFSNKLIVDNFSHKQLQNSSYQSPRSRPVVSLNNMSSKKQILSEDKRHTVQSQRNIRQVQPKSPGLQFSSHKKIQRKRNTPLNSKILKQSYTTTLFTHSDDDREILQLKEFHSENLGKMSNNHVSKSLLTRNYQESLLQDKSSCQSHLDSNSNFQQSQRNNENNQRYRKKSLQINHSISLQIIPKSVFTFKCIQQQPIDKRQENCLFKNFEGQQDQNINLSFDSLKQQSVSSKESTKQKANDQKIHINVFDQIQDKHKLKIDSLYFLNKHTSKSSYEKNVQNQQEQNSPVLYKGQTFTPNISGNSPYNITFTDQEKKDDFWTVVKQESSKCRKSIEVSCCQDNVQPSQQYNLIGKQDDTSSVERSLQIKQKNDISEFFRTKNQNPLPVGSRWNNFTSLYDNTKMTNSIVKNGSQNQNTRRSSPVKLQRLGVFKVNTVQSIIQDDQQPVSGMKQHEKFIFF